jgi:hypothetical protein
MPRHTLLRHSRFLQNKFLYIAYPSLYRPKLYNVVVTNKTTEETKQPYEAYSYLMEQELLPRRP